MRIGILGGTFNPPHLGHLICAQEAYLQLELDRVTLIPARIPPHKPVEDEPGPEHRLELCRVAVGDDERFDVSDVEITREGRSYTVDTLELLHSQDPESELFLIVGGDIAAGLPEMARARAGARRSPRSPWRGGAVRRAPRWTRRSSGLPGGERTEFFQMPTISVSSTVLRRRVRAGQPIRYYVPDPVVSYIDHHRLYGG